MPLLNSQGFPQPPYGIECTQPQHELPAPSIVGDGVRPAGDWWGQTCGCWWLYLDQRPSTRRLRGRGRFVGSSVEWPWPGAGTGEERGPAVAAAGTADAAFQLPAGPRPAQPGLGLPGLLPPPHHHDLTLLLKFCAPLRMCANSEIHIVKIQPLHIVNGKRCVCL